MRLNRTALLLARLPLLCLAAGILHGQVLVTLSTNNLALSAGGSATLAALCTVPSGSNTGVTWSYSPQVGTLGVGSTTTSGGLTTNNYLAPAVITSPTKVTITATSVQTPSVSGSVTIQLNPVDVGVGAPENLVNAFQNAFFRNGFNLLVTLPPVGNVKKLGPTGYVQEFTDKNSTARLALATVSPSAPGATDGTTLVVQLMADLYGHYITVGAGVAGLPLYDTLQCPPIDAGNSCTWDVFDKSYALFAYKAALSTGQDFTIRNVANSASILFYTEWTKQGGISGLSRPVDVETALTAFAVPPATTGTTATMQEFANGAIYSITSGLNRNTLFTVAQPIYGLYSTNNGPAGSLGLPVTQEIVLPNGDHRQTFEGGVLQYTPGGPGPVIRPPVTQVLVSGAAGGSTLTLNLGQAVTLTATPTAATGEQLKDRPVSWSTTSSRVATVTPGVNGTVVVKAVGGGAASITAASEGIASAKLNLIVLAPCCDVGDGAPPTVQQSFKDALTRNKIAVQPPIPGPAARVGAGYVQTVQAAGGSSTYVIAQSDKMGTAYVVGGAVLAIWQGLGAAGGTLGYPVSDLSAGGTQRFDSGTALAGNPLRMVSGGILTKWGLLGYETGAAGAPVSDATVFSTFGANSGVAQGFAGGAIYQATAGPRSPQAYVVTGLILQRYNAVGGPGGDYGMPTSDEFVTAGVHQQNFEGGNLTWSAGDSVAKEHPAAKTPGLIVSPSVLTAGSRAKFAVVGFPTNSTIRVSVAGQPDFTVTSANGAYSWDMFVPLSTKSGSVLVRAVDTKGASTASGTLTIRGFNDNRVAASKVQGDNQTGPPGALMPLALRVALRDSAGDPVVGAMVTFEASIGAQLSAAGVVTDASGFAETRVRLQNAEGIALVRADSPGIISSSVTFGLRSAATSLANFPRFQLAGDTRLGGGTATIGQKGALLTATSAILRYHQNRGELSSPNGPADPVTLNQFLANYCPSDTKGKQVCDGFVAGSSNGEQVVNLWRAAEFTGGAAVEVAPATPSVIADFLAQGSPVLLSLALSKNGAAAGGHFAVATGIAADGSITIQDPSPLFARTALAEYLTGFTAGGAAWKANVIGVARFALDTPESMGFLLAAISQPGALMQSLATAVNSAAGACGTKFDAFDAVDGSGNPAAGDLLLTRFVACEGSQPVYELQVGASQPYNMQLTDLAPGGTVSDLSGSALATWRVTREQFYLVVAPQSVSFTAAGVVSAATFTPGIAPGGLMSIFGAGLAGGGKATAVDLDGTPLRLALASPFQINAEVPLGMAPGVHVMRVQSGYGASQQQVTVSAVAPGIFLIGNPPLGAITNQNFSLVAPANPLARGQSMVIFATGLGAVTQSGQLSRTNAPVTVLLNGTVLPVLFAGLTPGYFGLYQVNVTIPAGAAPGLSMPLTLKVGEQLSNTVQVALQ
ncbi:MAG: papain-like cysteine protease family protein [Candidatus Solibacter sp.]